MIRAFSTLFGAALALLAGSPSLEAQELGRIGPQGEMLHPAPAPMPAPVPAGPQTPPGQGAAPGHVVLTVTIDVVSATQGAPRGVPVVVNTGGVEQDPAFTQTVYQVLQSRGYQPLPPGTPATGQYRFTVNASGHAYPGDHFQPYLHGGYGSASDGSVILSTPMPLGPTAALTRAPYHLSAMLSGPNNQVLWQGMVEAPFEGADRTRVHQALVPVLIDLVGQTHRNATQRLELSLNGQGGAPATAPMQPPQRQWR